MRALIQRSNKASVKVNGKITGKIKKGLVVLLAIHKEDSEEKISKMTDKLLNLRIFDDGYGKMNKSLIDTGGGILLISQFTLYADTSSGRRPSFTSSANGEKAEYYYNRLIEKLKNNNVLVESGEFGQAMKVELINDGPITIILDI